MKVMAGLVEADQGLRVVPRQWRWIHGTGPNDGGFATLGDYAASALEPGNFTVWNAQARG